MRVGALGERAGRSRALGTWIWGCAALLCVQVAVPQPARSDDVDEGAGGRSVGALGRIEPDRGVRRIAGPPRAAVVIEELRVEEGDPVERGDVLAVLQGIEVLRADLAQAEAELAQAERELRRREGLRRGGAAPDAELEAARLAVDVAKARQARATAEVELSRVRAPISGRVLEVNARAGELVGPEGILELGDTTRMFVIAEVYETDIGRVRVGQPAQVASPALRATLSGVVERVGFKIGKKDVLDTDPVADADARVVEVAIRLEDPAAAANLTNLRVDVVIGP